MRVTQPDDCLARAILAKVWAAIFKSSLFAPNLPANGGMHGFVNVRRSVRPVTVLSWVVHCGYDPGPFIPPPRTLAHHTPQWTRGSLVVAGCETLRACCCAIIPGQTNRQGSLTPAPLLNVTMSPCQVGPHASNRPITRRLLQLSRLGTAVAGFTGTTQLFAGP